ncbi:hypothetical protein G6F42_017849 [Rhizopus arrhizus]|nr:hypothetical protein G6F42_017849 [Rhizopus arrhizus]
MADNQPVPAPKKVKMPVMTEADKKNLGISAGSPAPSSHAGGGGKGGGGGGGGGGGAGGAMMGGHMMNSPMCPPMMGGGYPGNGGMGPNLVFNFNQPYGYVMAAVAGGGGGGGGGGDDGGKDKAEEKEEEQPKPEYVQADPTWRNPRMVQEKGKPLKKEPCVIQ